MGCMSFIAFISACWMVGDMILDMITTHTYKKGCDAGTLPCGFWVAGLAFILLPSVVVTLVVIFVSRQPTRQPTGRLRLVQDLAWWEKVLVGPCFIVGVPLLAIVNTGWALCGDEGMLGCGDEEDYEEEISWLKMAEVVCEAAPQVGRATVGL